VNHFRSTFLVQMLVVCVIAFGLLAAPFAEASTVAVGQVYKAVAPNPDLSAMVNSSNFSVTTSVVQRSRDNATAQGLIKHRDEVIGITASATNMSAIYLPRAALLERRCCSLPTMIA